MEVTPTVITVEVSLTPEDSEHIIEKKECQECLFS